MPPLQPKDPFVVMMRRMSCLTLEDRGNKQRERAYGIYKLNKQERIKQHDRSLQRIEQLRKVLLGKQTLLHRARMKTLPIEQHLDDVTVLTTKLNYEYGVLDHMCSTTPINPFSIQVMANENVQDESSATISFGPRVKTESCFSDSVICYEPSDQPNFSSMDGKTVCSSDHYVCTSSNLSGRNATCDFQILLSDGEQYALTATVFAYQRHPAAIRNVLATTTLAPNATLLGQGGKKKFPKPQVHER